VLLSKDEGAVLAEKVAKHAGKDTAVESIVLVGRVTGAGDEFPFVQVGERAAFLVLVFVLQVAKEVAEVLFATSAHAVVKLNALELHENDGADPVHVVLIDGKEDLVEFENVLACENVMIQISAS